MVSRFVRRVRTASGAVAVQVVTKQGAQVLEVDHVGSAHSDEELAVLLEVAGGRLRPGQEVLDLAGLAARPVRMEDTSNFTAASGVPAPAVSGDVSGGVAAAGPLVPVGPARVVSTSSLILWQTLVETYSRVGLDVLGDEAFGAMVLAQIVEPTSKVDSLRVLAGLGAPGPDRSTLFRALKRCQHKDYRSQIAVALAGFSSRAGRLGAMVMYDVTTLHFEITHEDDGPDGLRKVGMSKEHRVDPQVQVGLLVDPSGFPLEAHLFVGNQAETKTIIPVLQSFQKRHGITDLVVVADAGMLSAGNLNAIEDAGFSFIVGSRLTKAPYDLAEHFTAKGDYFTDGQILESVRAMGQGKAERGRRIVYQWRFARSKRDNRNIKRHGRQGREDRAGQSPVQPGPVPQDPRRDDFFGAAMLGINLPGFDVSIKPGTVHQSIRRGTFASIQVLINQIRHYIDTWNADARPFAWTATAGEILAKVQLTQTNIKKFVENNGP